MTTRVHNEIIERGDEKNFVSRIWVNWWRFFFFTSVHFVVTSSTTLNPSRDRIHNWVNATWNDQQKNIILIF